MRALSNSAGTVTDTYDYDAWGNAVDNTGSTPNAYLYRGERYDSDLNLYYLRARYFNPQSGTFLTMDADSGRVTEPMTLHKYSYGGADPVNRLDPSGRSSIDRAILIGALVLRVGVSPAINSYGKSLCKVVTPINTLLQLADKKKKVTWLNRRGEKVEFRIDPKEGLADLFEGISKWCETFY